MHKLLISDALLGELRRRADEAAPRECCGLLVGRLTPVATVTRMISADNVHPDPARFFTIDPAVQFALLRDLRHQEQADGATECLLGHYHSHPFGPAAPSARDLAEATDADLLWLIIAADSGAIGAYAPRTDDRGAIIAFDPLTIVPTPPKKP